ncbi:MAG: excinuclease ABC subunit UvrA [Coriobacteriaceae bacterium]|nr:excinuclease ABC subunit UvrA [Coriobacteriaceae bacterium]
MTKQPDHISVRGARVHNLKDIDVDIPLGEFVGIAGVSGSGKSSLALGVLYAEGSRRYLDALSTYTRRRISQSSRAEVDEVLHVPAALALRQRPPVPDVRSTFGTSTELLNYLRLAFSRLGSHACPNGHVTPPTMNVALEREIECQTCGERFFGPGAEAMAFNSEGACPTCSGTGIVRTVDPATLVPDESKTIDEGAVVVWGSLMWSLMKDVCREMGVRTDVPFRDLTPEERDIVYHGPAEKKHLLYHNEKTGIAGEMDFTYYNAIYTVENALSKVKDEKGLKRVAKFLKEAPCPDCGGTRLSAKVRSTTLCGINLAQATALTLDELAEWIPTVAPSLPAEMRPMAESILAGMAEPIARLQQLGLGYLSLDRASSTLSTGELQRVQLTRAVRNRTTGVLYVLDEPSIGLHPSNVDGLLGVVDDLIADGNSVLIADHDVRVLRHCDHLIEIGPGSGASGGSIIAQGTVAEVAASPGSRIAGFLANELHVKRSGGAQTDPQGDLFEHGGIYLKTGAIHTVKPLEVHIPRGRLTAVTGVSGSGKTTLVLESLIPGLQAAIGGTRPPAHVLDVDGGDLRRVNLIDAAPIGVNVRSTVATYSGVLDDLRRAYASSPAAKERGLKAGAFSYNTGSLRCPTCDGTGQISLDVQFLPDVDIVCPDCRGSRYSSEAWKLTKPLKGPAGTSELALPALMAMTVDEALEVCGSMKKAAGKLQILHDLGLGYLTLGEATPALSGGEAQRLKLASEIGRDQRQALFVFDEPTIGLHPLDVEVLLGVLQGLIDHGATVVVIEHDLDMIANADYIIDLGPGGGEAGGRIVACGTPDQVRANPESITARYL